MQHFKPIFTTAILGLAAFGLAFTAIPASAHEFALPSSGASYGASYERAPAEQVLHHSRDRSRYDRRGHHRYARYDEPVYRDTRTWRGRDGRRYCRKSNGTTGLIVGAAAGALLGRGIDTHGERATGTILGAAAGALLGKSVAGGTRCR